MCMCSPGKYIWITRSHPRMSFLFGGAPEANSVQRDKPTKMDAQRTQLRAAIRRLTREETTNARSERLLGQEITKHAKAQDMSICMDKARELIRVRAHTSRLRKTRSQLTAISRQLSMLSHTVLTGESMLRLTLFMRDMNKEIDVRGMHRMCNEFERQHVLMGETVSTMDEKMDETFAADDEDTCTDDMVASVFAELGVDIQGKVQAPRTRIAAPEPLAEAGDVDLEERLRRLRA